MDVPFIPFFTVGILLTKRVGNLVPAITSGTWWLYNC
jgi:hypothetical protein